MSNKDRGFDWNQFSFWVSGFSKKSDAIVHLSTETGIGFFVCRRIVQGKRTPKNKAEQTAICSATGLDMDTLFPVVENKKESA